MLAWLLTLTVAKIGVLITHRTAQIPIIDGKRLQKANLSPVPIAVGCSYA
jgi:hypothetical protein